MSVAAYEAGASFSNSSVTLIHGMSRPIGAVFHVPTLAEYGIEKEGKIDKMAADAMKSGSPFNMLKYIDKKGIAELYKSLWGN